MYLMCRSMGYIWSSQSVHRCVLFLLILLLLLSSSSASVLLFFLTFFILIFTLLLIYVIIPHIFYSSSPSSSSAPSTNFRAPPNGRNVFHGPESLRNVCPGLMRIRKPLGSSTSAVPTVFSGCMLSGSKFAELGPELAQQQHPPWGPSPRPRG